MRNIFVFFFSILFVFKIFSQVTLSVQNSSFEGMPAETITPVPWDNCNFGLTPDTQPGFFGVNEQPHDGNTYLGILHDYDNYPNNPNGWQEGAGQVLSAPMIAGQTYTFSVWMQQSTSYSFSADPIELEVYGGWSNCDQAELLASSGAVVAGVWTEYTFSITPSDNYPYILLLAHNINETGNPYLLVDDMSNIVPCNVNIDSINVVDTRCGLNNGSIEIFTNASYSYEWNTGDLNSAITNLQAGDYSVTMSTANGLCSWDTTITINPSEELNATNTKTDVSCFGLSDGKIEITPTNGTAPYTYTWSNGNNTNINSNLSANTYYVTVTDSFGCVFSDTIIINQPNVLDVSIIGNNALCFGTNTGSATVNIVGGTSPYSYTWSNGDTTNTAGNLQAGTYILTVTDSHNCNISDTIEISQPSELQISLSASELLCYGDTNGEVSVTVTGGTPSYSYLWNTGTTSNLVNNLSGGIYTVTVSDANGCIKTDSVELTSVGEPLQINYTKTDNPCFGYNEGVINTNVTGGTPPYSYKWNTTDSTSNLSNLYAGTYNLTVTDTNECAVSESIIINEPTKLFVSLPADQTICKNSDFQIQSSTQGGTTPYQYYWNTGNVADNISINLIDSAIYSITVTDANNCTATDEIKINTFELPHLISSANKDTVCPGDPVVISSTVTGGASPFTYTVNGDIADFEQTVYPYQTTLYQTKVTDACGNFDNNQVSIYTYNIPVLSISSDVLQGCPPLTVSFNEGSNVNGAIYNWNFDDNDENNYTYGSQPTHTFDQSGVYDVSVEMTTKEGCKVQQTISDMITVFPQPEAMFEVSPEVVSIIDPTVDFTNLSTENYNNYWYFGDGEMSSIVNPYHKYSNIGEYDVTLVVKSEYGCVDSVKHHISVQDEFTLYVPTAFTPDGDGINDGFKAVGNGIDTDNFILRIYDRWGEVIWESTDLYEEWKGTAKNSNKIVQNGTYKWLIICKDFNGVEYTKSGNVTVVR